ncbi:tetratricopeptide repeat-containing sensor histidine kinase [Flavobacterium sp. HNIBRBA15423]|uniref:tetratricopeptide repeat-containing sensor histidine kinase n=1 Tax=Flavobacterium sp. HNIBRBA15423 TaxID=3458683 RepID=UPI004044DB1E
MQFIMKHFPFLFVLLFLFSCNNKEDAIIIDNYKQFIDKAITYKDTIFNLDSAYYYFNKAKLSCNKKQADRIVYLLAEMAKIQKIKGDYSGSEATATEAFDYFNEVKDSSFIYSIYSSLGTSYQRMLDFDNALKYYNLCLKGKISENDKLTILNNKGVIYIVKNDFQSAIKIYQSLIKTENLKQDRIEYARIIDNLGFAYFNIGEKNKAYHYISESLRIKDSIGDEYQKLAPLMHLSRFFKDSIISESNKFAINAYDIATKVNSPDDRLEALDILIRNTSNKDEFKNYYEKFSFLRDSIDVVRQTVKNQFANIKYESRLAIEESENQKKQKIIYLLLFVVSVLIALFIIYIIRKKNKEREKRIGYETETRISKKLHDELANDVFNTMTFIDTQDLQNPDNKENVLQGLDAIYDKARNISKQTGEVKTGKEFGVVLNQLLMSYNSKQVTVIVKGSSAIDWEKIKANKQIEIHRILSELLVNMKKHSQAKLVLVTFETLEKTIKIQYKDDGIGFEKEKIIKNGLLNVENRIHEINGSITFDTETNKGLKINIEFPK